MVSAERMCRPRRPYSAALVIAVHNRCEITERFLQSLKSQAPHAFDLRLFITDDGSSDGTFEMLARLVPEAKILLGDGLLFWAGGMRKALEAARPTRPSVFLLMNDDVELDRTALRRLAEVHLENVRKGSPAILVGSTYDVERACVSYGGFRCTSKNLLRMQRVQPDAVILSADTFNANCVLVPGEVMEALNGFEPKFTHSMADIDLGLRARAIKVPILVLPGYFGTCAINSRSVIDGVERLNFREFWRRLVSPRYLPPREWFLITKRHAGRFWFLSAVGAYFNAFARYLFRRLVSSQKQERR